MNLPPLAWCFLSPRGRLTRQEFLLAIGLIFVLLSIVFHITLAGDTDSAAQHAADDTGAQTLVGFAILGAIWPTYAAEWKRLQDIGWPGYLAVVAGVAAGALMAVNVWVGLAAEAAILVYLGAMPAEAGSNRWGPRPTA